MSAREQQALPCEGVEGRGLYPGVAVGADVVLPEAVYDHQDHVRTSPPAREVVIRYPRHLVGEAGAPGHAEQRRPGRADTSGPQEVPGRQRFLRFLAHSRLTFAAFPKAALYQRFGAPASQACKPEGWSMLLGAYFAQAAGFDLVDEAADVVLIGDERAAQDAGDGLAYVFIEVRERLEGEVGLYA